MTIDGYIAGWHGNRVLILFYGDSSDKAFLDLTGDGLRIWEGAQTVQIVDGKTYSVQVDMIIGALATVTVKDFGTGTTLITSSKDCSGQCKTDDQWGLQLGTYFFHYEPQSPEGTLTMQLHDLRIASSDQTLVV